MAEAVHTGGCLCGAVRYSARAPLGNATICHCDMCRKAAGAPWMAFVVVTRDQVEFTGEPRALYRSSAIASRGFCGRCGTALTWEGDKHPDMVDIAIATLDEPARVPPTDQIFAAEAIGWAQDLSTLPSYPGHRTA